MTPASQSSCELRKNDRMRLTRPRSLPFSLMLAAPLLGAAFVVSAQTPAPAVEPASAAALPAPLPSAPKPTALTLAPSWSGLTPAQRVILAPLEQEWHQLGPDRRLKWLEVANRMPDLPVEEQARMQERMRDWARLSPKERSLARIGFQAARQVDADERRAKWEAYQALPLERRAELAQQGAKKQAALAAQAPSSPTTLGAQTKSNLVPAAPKVLPVAPVAASLVQARPGATTVLITRPITPPLHQEAGQPKVIADPSLVDPKTLLPKSLKPAARPASS